MTDPAASPSSPSSPSSDTPFSLPKDDTTWAFVAHALSFVEGGILGPLLLYVAMKDRSEFVAFHALQSFYFGLLLLVATLLSCGLLLIVLLIPYFVFEIIACTKAINGEWYRLPVAGAMAWQRHHPRD